VNFDRFCAVHSDIWHSYFSKIHSAISNGVAKLGDGVLLFPNMVLYTETNEHYLAEFFGASTDYTSLDVRRHKETSTIKYLYQFSDREDSPKITMDVTSGLKNVLLSRRVDYERVKERFGIDVCQMFPTRLVLTKGNGGMLSFADSLQVCSFDNCLLINTYQNIYRIKAILNLTVASKTIHLSQLVREMSTMLSWPVRVTDELYGVYFCSQDSVQAQTLSGQFANLFLIPGLREPNIGYFLKNNPSFVHNALSCTDFFHEQRLDWINGSSHSGQKYIQPDLLLKLANGHWDICDLKKPLLDKANITKGKPSRRRFIDYVAEGIAQLAAYEDYFKHKINADYAVKKFGITVDNPQLVLVVGNYENTDIYEVKEAARVLKPNYTIIDYDTLNANSLSKCIPI